MRKELARLLLNNIDLVLLLACYIWGMAGIILKMLIEAAKRKPEDPRTPERFSVRFFLRDNALRLFINMIALFAGIIFASEMFGQAATVAGAFFLGLGVDALVKSGLYGKKFEK